MTEYILIAVLVLFVGNHFIGLKKKKAREKYFLQGLDHINKREEELNTLMNTYGQAKHEQEKVKSFMKKNEVVLYGIKERTLDLWHGHNGIETVLGNIMEEEEIPLEMEEVQYLGDIRSINYRKKKEIENWFINSFRMTVQDYIKRQEGINKYGFSNN